MSAWSSCPTRGWTAAGAIVKPERVVPAIVEFVDIAGLVAGASKGEGLGNQFLSHIRETDAIVNVVRCFEDENVIHVAGKVDPISDIEVIQTELCLADLATVEKSLHRYTKAGPGRQRQGGAAPGQDVLQKCQAALDQARPVRSIDFSKEELAILKPLCLITAKPAMFVGNVAETGFENNPFLERLRTTPRQKAPVVAICAKTEAELADMGDEDKALFLAEMGQDEPGLNRLIRAAFKLLGLQTYFTAGVKEVRAWTIHIGDTAPQAAGVIHTDFERGFIRAQTIAYDDFIAFKGEQGREGRRQDARRRQGIRRQGRRRAELPVQRLMAGRKAGDIDMLIVRENTEGEYSSVGGVMFGGTEREFVLQESVFTRHGSERLLNYAFELARTRARKHVTVATKSNGIAISMPWWDERAAEAAARFPDISWDKQHIDILAARFVLQPQRFDVVAATNLFGDILSDLGPACTGTIGIAPSANLNPERTFPSLFEPVHGRPLVDGAVAGQSGRLHRP
jgi:GTP-binding protein YchF